MREKIGPLHAIGQNERVREMVTARRVLERHPDYPVGPSLPTIMPLAAAMKLSVFDRKRKK
jgi:hypothetical protein